MLIILVAVKYDWGRSPEWPKILFELTQEGVRYGTPAPNRWKKRMSCLCQRVGWKPEAVFAHEYASCMCLSSHQRCSADGCYVLRSEAHYTWLLWWAIKGWTEAVRMHNTLSGGEGVAILHYSCFQGQRLRSYRVWKVALMSKTCKEAWPSVVINAPLPRAINLGFVGPVPTRLIVSHLLKFPLALTAVFSVVVRQCLQHPPSLSTWGCGLHYWLSFFSNFIMSRRGYRGACHATKKISLRYHASFLNDVPERQTGHLLPKGRLHSSISREEMVLLMMQSPIGCSQDNKRGHSHQKSACSWLVCWPRADPAEIGPFHHTDPSFQENVVKYLKAWDSLVSIMSFIMPSLVSSQPNASCF